MQRLGGESNPCLDSRYEAWLVVAFDDQRKSSLDLIARAYPQDALILLLA